MFQYSARVLRVVDGDTLRLDLDLGFKVHIEEIVRLARINAPENAEWTAKGLQDPARNYIEQNTPPGSSVVADISKPDKYGRWLADIRFLPGSSVREDILQNGRVLNDELVQHGFAMPYGK